MRFLIFLLAWSLVLGISVIYVVVGAITDASASLVARRRAQAVEKISILLFESEDQAAAIFEDVADLPRRTLLSLIQTLAVDLDGQARNRLQNLVAASGLQRFVRRRAKSRRWRMRVQAAQLNYLVIHPDFDRRLLLHDPHPLVRARAVEALTEVQAAEVVEDLVGLLTDESLAVRIAAQRGLVNAGSASIPVLLHHLEFSVESPLAARARWPPVCPIAADVGDRRFTLRSRPDGSGRWPSRALGSGIGDEGIPMLHRLIDDHEPDVRAKAIGALGHLGSQTSVALIGESLARSLVHIRRASGLALDALSARASDAAPAHLRNPKPIRARDMARQMLDAEGGSSWPRPRPLDPVGSHFPSNRGLARRRRKDRPRWLAALSLPQHRRCRPIPRPSTFLAPATAVVRRPIPPEPSYSDAIFAALQLLMSEEEAFDIAEVSDEP
ncbi:MAG: HEAT repeat domain-containing protein [Acidimicrobiales bacterium]